jgi:hypothetical protein
VQAGRPVYLVDIVTQTLQLFDTPPSLFIRVVSSAYGAHACRFVTGVTLCAIVKIRIRSSWAVSAMD